MDGASGYVVDLKQLADLIKAEIMAAARTASRRGRDSG
jgi:hypothetical protein